MMRIRCTKGGSLFYIALCKKYATINCYVTGYFEVFVSKYGEGMALPRGASPFRGTLYWKDIVVMIIMQEFQQWFQNLG